MNDRNTDQLAAGLERMGREARRGRHPGAAAGWARVQARMRAGPRAAWHGLRRAAWSAMAVATVLAFVVVLPAMLETRGVTHTPPAAAYAPAWTRMPDSSGTGQSDLASLGPTRTATQVHTPAGDSGDMTALSQFTIPPEPVPPAPVDRTGTVQP